MILASPLPFMKMRQRWAGRRTALSSGLSGCDRRNGGRFPPAGDLRGGAWPAGHVCRTGCGDRGGQHIRRICKGARNIVRGTARRRASGRTPEDVHRGARSRSASQRHGCGPCGRRGARARGHPPGLTRPQRRFWLWAGRRQPPLGSREISQTEISGVPGEGFEHGGRSHLRRSRMGRGLTRRTT